MKYKEDGYLCLFLFVSVERNLLINYSLMSCWFRFWGGLRQNRSGQNAFHVLFFIVVYL